MSETKKYLLIKMITTCLLSLLLGILLITIDGNTVIRIFGIILIVHGIISLITSINRIARDLAFTEIVFGLIVIFLNYQIVQVITGTCLMVIAIYNIYLNKNDWKSELKAQLPSIILGLALIFFSLGTVVDLILTIIGSILIIFSIIYLILGSISLSKHQ